VRKRVAIVIALLLVVQAGCVSVRRTDRRPDDRAAMWLATQKAASRVMEAQTFSMAEQLFNDFAAKYPGTPEATETLFWRALYRIDPANKSPNPREALSLLDRYLASGNDAPHALDAMVVRRLIVATQAPTTGAVAGLRERVQDDSTQKLRDDLTRVTADLARVTAELERIKKRMAAPR